MHKGLIKFVFGNEKADSNNIVSNENNSNRHENAGYPHRRPRHRHRYRKPRINPIEDAIRRVDTKDFNITKSIPHLTRQHIVAWVVDDKDDTDMLIQFNCKAHCFGFRNVRLNCYMMKPSKEHPDGCLILDLRDLGKRTSISITTAFFPEEFLDGQDLLEYILVDVFGSMPLWDLTDLVAFITGEISFHRTRTLTEEERNKPIL